MSSQATNTPLIETRMLSRYFGHGEQTVHAVDEVNFSVQPGEIVAIVGESGSGKSTLARLLLHLSTPTAGQMFLDGKDVTGLSSSRALKPYWRRVQGVFQDPFAAVNQFYSNRRVLENALKLLEKRPPKQERARRVNEALMEVGLVPAECLYKGPHQLSGGQLQRVMIARALMVNPDVLIADEPTSMLDASLRVTVLNLLLDLRERHNMTILFITHDIGQAYYVSDRALVMYHGKIVEQGPVEEVMHNPKHEYTIRLMADVPLLRGRETIMEE